MVFHCFRQITIKFFFILFYSIADSVILNFVFSEVCINCAPLENLSCAIWKLKATHTHAHTYLTSVMSPSLQRDVALPALLLNVGMA